MDLHTPLRRSPYLYRHKDALAAEAQKVFTG